MAHFSQGHLVTLQGAFSAIDLAQGTIFLSTNSQQRQVRRRNHHQGLAIYGLGRHRARGRFA